MTPERKVALVTGSTSGIGLEIAKTFLSDGYIVCFNYHSDKARAEKLFSELPASCIYVFPADVSDEKQVANMFEEIHSSLGQLDVLVNNAGTSINEPIDAIDLSNFKKVLDVNFIGKVLCTKYAIPLLKKSDSSCIINIASRLGIKPCVGASAYCASEAAIINFTHTSALELAKHKIRVNSISPGMMITPLTLSKWSEEDMENQKRKIPLGRLGHTTDIASVVTFLVSEGARYISGENINVSGGVLLT